MKIDKEDWREMGISGAALFGSVYALPFLAAGYLFRLAINAFVIGWNRGEEK